MIEGSSRTHYDAIYSAYLDVQRMVRVGDYKLIIYPKVPVTLLFNLKDDGRRLQLLALAQIWKYQDK